MKKVILLGLSLIWFSCNTSAQKKKETKQYEVSKTEAEWKDQLSEEAFNVLRKAGTERAFSSDLNNNHENGIFVCRACNTPLFKSEHKFDSGSGWPSFDRTIEDNVEFSTDRNLGYSRTEELCATCGGHLGHVFNDGPKDTTGQRHCINGVSLTFIPKDE